MSFDPITLAMAKTYTDEKVESGGSGGGGVTLPVVEITTMPADYGSGEEPAQLTAVEVEQIEAALETGLPITWRFLKNYPTYSAILIQESEYSYMYYDHYMEQYFTIKKQKSGTWTFYFTD